MLWTSDEDRGYCHAYHWVFNSLRVPRNIPFQAGLRSCFWWIIDPAGQSSKDRAELRAVSKSCSDIFIDNFGDYDRRDTWTRPDKWLGKTECVESTQLNGNNAAVHTHSSAFKFVDHRSSWSVWTLMNPNPTRWPIGSIGPTTIH